MPDGMQRKERDFGVLELPEKQVRAMFDDVICLRCGKSAAGHELHNGRYLGGCPWTWIGVVRNSIAQIQPIEASESNG